ncbi:MAG TPA: SRPBCC family protein [Gemmatimonadales bacterium]|nr:SRPBCC family protein [Gemmatimonadales bacterium]
MASTHNGSSERWENLRRHKDEKAANVGKMERLVSGLAGVVLVGLSLRKRRLRPILFPVATGLIARALTGRGPAKRALAGLTRRENRDSRVASVGRGKGTKVEQSVTINRPVLEVYRFWRNFENLPRFMDHLEAVTVIDENRSRWVAKGPAGTRVEWDAVIHNEIDDELIAWRSLPGSEISHAGSVHFTPSDDGAATEVRVVLSYEPPAGQLGVAVAKLLGEEPTKQVAEDLRRLKQVMDSGEVATGSRARRQSQTAR